jgi:hypothetical protein
MPQRKNKAILIRTEEENIQSFKKSISENKVSTYAEGLKCLLIKEGSEVFLEYQECEFFSEYPLDSKHFIQCSYGKSGKRPRKREHCQACAHNREIKVLMQSRGKIGQQNSELQRKASEAQHKLGDLNTEIVGKRKELEKIESLSNMPEQLRKKEKEIADLRGHYELELRNEKDKTKYLEDECRARGERNEELQRQVETLQRPSESVLEAEKKLSEEKQPIAAPAQKVEASKTTQTIQRVTEREKIEKERIVETVTSDPFTNQEIECPLKGQQYVDIIAECKRGCKDFYQCPFWEEINKGTLPLEAKIRERRLV